MCLRGFAKEIVIYHHPPLSLDSPGGSDSKVSAYNVGDRGSIPGLGRSPGEGNGNPLQYSCLENPMERNMAGYSPWCYTESEMRGDVK